MFMSDAPDRPSSTTRRLRQRRQDGGGLGRGFDAAYFSQLPAELTTLAWPPPLTSQSGGSTSLASANPPPLAVARAKPPDVEQTASATESGPAAFAFALQSSSASATAVATCC